MSDATSSVKPHHLVVSLQSLQSICAKKLNDKHLIDNAELFRFHQNVRESLAEYQQNNTLPELGIILQRMPAPRSYQLTPGILFLTSNIYKAIGGAIAAFLPFFFLYAVIPLFFWSIGAIAGWLLFAKRRSRIADDLKQISECSATAIMLITNNESYR